jgi:hypothetical protein
MPKTARKHFDQDMARARAILAEATGQGDGSPVAADLARAAVAFAVGAMDAYLCDAYVDSLSRCLKAHRQGKISALPGPYGRELLPVGPLMAKHYTKKMNWALRMAARTRMERENLLQIARVRELLNPVLLSGQKLWIDIIDAYIAVGRKRLTRYVAADLQPLTGDPLQKKRQDASKRLLGRMGEIVQRRHDIVHNVDRPKSAPQKLTHGQARAMLRDVETFVSVLDDHLDKYRTC